MEKVFPLIVEQGPDQGMKISIPAEGARAGRSANNDIVFSDPAMSRFHCRFFFKSGEGLWAEDLGSSNQSELNGRPFLITRVRLNDRLMIGDTILKVINDGTPAADTNAAPQEPMIQITPETPAPAPAPADDSPPPAKDSSTLDNLFARTDEKPSAANIRFKRAPAGTDRPSRKKTLLVLLLALAIFALIVVFLPDKPQPQTAASVAPSELDDLVEIVYEKVQANAQNIFRYHMVLKNNRLSIQIDDLQNHRHVAGDQRHSLAPDLVNEIAVALRQSGFFDLKEEYKGLGSEVWDVWDLSITIGKKTHHVQVLNAIEPPAFKSARETLEIFGQNELGLTALALSPEKLLELARDAWLLAKSLYDQRNIKEENLAKAIRCMKEAEWYLETIEPKPDFYPDTVASRGAYEHELQQLYDEHLFLAERAVKLNDWAEAAMQYRLICEKIPDRADERHDAARKKLIDVERRLKRKQ